MFSMMDFERVRTENTRRSILDAVLFSIEKNPFAYAMNLHNSHDRGRYTEKLVKNKLEEYGFDVFHCGDSCDYDLLISSSIRAEVKLATIQPYGKYTKYCFHKIKPECFDVLFLVFLNPHGMTIKWSDSEMVAEWSVDYKRGKNGYQITFDQNMKSKNLVYNETLESFVRLFM